jgi:hypothetical protein
MKKIVFFNEEAQKMFLSLPDKNEGTEDSYISESLKKLIDAVDQGLSYDEIKENVLDPVKFAREYWMELHSTAKTPEQKREAVLELKRLMLLIDGKPVD